MNSSALLQLRREISLLVESRNAIIAEECLDAKFCTPDGNWRLDGDNDYRRRYEELRDCDVAEIPTVIRPLSQNYSGYKFPEKMFEAINKPCVYRWELVNKGSRHLYRPLLLPGEHGSIVEGVVVNEDTFTYQNYLNLLVSLGIVEVLEKSSHPVIVEIGAGYGALALALLQILGNKASYAICDLPESLLFSGSYLALADCRVLVGGGETGVALVPNFWFHRLVDTLEDKVDLVINTLSMSEMSEHQVRVYAEGIAKMIGSDGVFFEHNFDNRHMGLTNCKDYLGDYFDRRSVGAGGLCDIWKRRQ